MKVKAVVDRIEGKLAVLEITGKGEICWPVKFLPKGTSAGNILDFQIIRNRQAERTQQIKIKELRQRLINR